MKRAAEREKQGRVARGIQVALAVAVGVFVVAAAYISTLVFERQHTLGEISRYNVAFSAGQGVSEYMRLRQRLSSLALQHGSEAAEREALLRFEILLNRLSLFQGGDFATFVSESPEREAVMERIAGTMAELEPLMRSLDNRDSVVRALAITRPLETGFMRLASEANHWGGQAVANDQLQLFRLHWTFTAVSISLAVCGFVLFGMNRWQNRQLVTARHSLADANVELAEQNRLFEAALNNMSHGLVMFDSSERLIVSNRQMEKIFGLDEGGVRPGVSFLEYLEVLQQAGVEDDCSLIEIRDAARRFNAEGHRESMLQTLGDGRTVQLIHQPMEGGGWTATYEDITERHNAQEQVAHMARHDALTGLPNRVMLRERLEDRLAADRNSGRNTAVMCIDLDNFKNINDTHGHPFGDLLLQEVSARIRALFRETDTVSRVGGDEFIIVCGGLEDPRCLEDRAAALIRSLGEPYRIEGHQVLSGASVGIATSGLHESACPDDLLKNADIALYEAKSAGRGTFSFYRDEMSRQMQRRSRIEAGLLSADWEERFQLAFQPITELATGKVKAVEALLRWKNPCAKDPVSPQEVISIAEDTGMIVDLGAWVLRKACMEAAKMPDGVSVAVNLSPVQFRRGNIVETVTKVLSDTGLPASRLDLEITETLLLDDSGQILDDLAGLKALGTRISLDDFGTGYSSLSYLRKFSVDKIKIDRMFVLEIGLNKDHRAIVQTIVDMAVALGMTTVAEGVETKEQMNALVSAGCHEAQGYLYSKPLPPDGLRRYFQEARRLTKRREVADEPARERRWGKELPSKSCRSN